MKHANAVAIVLGIAVLAALFFASPTVMGPFVVTFAVLAVWFARVLRADAREYGEKQDKKAA